MPEAVCRTLVVSHEHADFDALASLVAATKLFPGSVFVQPASVGREVHPYLALHRDRFEGVPLAAVQFAEVEELVIVDVRSKARLAHIAPLLERLNQDPASLTIRVFDHHAAREDDVPADEEIVAPVGSALTLLVERLDADRIEIDPVEATLFALGVHSDTGSLSFANTTSRDARVLARLLELGADVTLVARYLNAPFGQLQRTALAKVLSGTEVIYLGGLGVGFALVHLRAKASGLDEVTSRAIDILGLAALFVVYELRPGKVHIIARAASDSIDVAEALKSFGGGGHAAAAACSIKDTTPNGALNSVRSVVESLRLVARSAVDIMSSPPHQVAPSMTLGDLSRTLAEWRSTGACVVRDGKLLGVISHRDVARAKSTGRLGLPVSGYMSTNVVSVGPDTPIDEVLNLMQSKDVGRLPVVRDERVLGMVTRADALRALYERPVKL